MTLGTFWAHVTTLCHVYNGKVISGPRSVHWNRHLKGTPYSAHTAGLGADIEFTSNEDRDLAAGHAAKMGLSSIPKQLALHMEPKDYQ